MAADSELFSVMTEEKPFEMVQQAPACIQAHRALPVAEPGSVA